MFKVFVGVRMIVCFFKCIEFFILKWGVIIYVEGEIKLSYVFVKFGYLLKRN